ncbi:MAG: metallophosphoesterase family protein [Akkermansiaceae bacterium]
MKNRRQFIKMTTGAAVVGALGTNPSSAAETSKPRKTWVMSDIHCGYSEGGKDGAEWFSLACKDMQEEHKDISYAMALGDLTHGGNEQQLKNYITTRDGSGIKTWYEVAGNHEYHGGKADFFTTLIRSTDPYSVIDGNLVWIFLSDQKAGVAGELTPEACDWLEAELAKHKGKNIIVCSHQGVKDTTIDTDLSSRHLAPADRIATMIAKSDVVLWMSGHAHHKPYSAEYVKRVETTTYINVASMSHAYKTGSSQSFLLEFKPGAKEIIARRRIHDTKTFLPEFEVKVPLLYPLTFG